MLINILIIEWFVSVLPPILAPNLGIPVELLVVFPRLQACIPGVFCLADRAEAPPLCLKLLLFFSGSGSGTCLLKGQGTKVTDQAIPTSILGILSRPWLLYQGGVMLS